MGVYLLRCRNQTGRLAYCGASQLKAEPASDALSAGVEAFGLPSQLAAVMDQETHTAGELVFLSRQNAHSKRLRRQVRARELEVLGRLSLVHVYRRRSFVIASRFQFFETVFSQLFVSLTGRVVISRHFVTPTLK
jgi:hypothetical protein